MEKDNIVFGTILSRQREEKTALRCFKSMKPNRKNTDRNKENSLLATLREPENH